MARYATGKYALGISDRSGRAYKLTNMLREWNGLLVGNDEFETKQPQLDPRHHITDPEALRNSRPARIEPAVMVLLEMDPFISGSSGSATITVIEPGHGRSTGDMEDSDGFSITKVNSNRYTFVSGSGTATAGNVRGGGGSVSAGPVTVSA